MVITVVAVGLAGLAWFISSPVKLSVAHVDKSIVAGDEVMIVQAGDSYTILICTFVSHDEESGTAYFRMPWKARWNMHDGGEDFWVQPYNFTLHDGSSTEGHQR